MIFRLQLHPGLTPSQQECSYYVAATEREMSVLEEPPVRLKYYKYSGLATIS